MHRQSREQGVGAAQKKLLRDGDVVTTIIDGIGTIVNNCRRVSDHTLPLSQKA